MTKHPESWNAPFTELQLRQMWTYGDGTSTVKAYWEPAAGRWMLVDPGGNVLATVRTGDFSRRFRPVDAFADVTGFPTYLGTVTGPDGTAQVDLLLDRNPFMLANGPQRVARPHALMVPRKHRDGWSSATEQELAARQVAMTLVAAWYQSLDDGEAVFAANDSAPNLAGDATVKKNARQEVQHAHLHAFYAERDETENQEAGHPVPALGVKAYSETLDGDTVRVDADSTTLAAALRAAAQPWGGSYCSYQLGLDGPLWAMPALGQSQDEFNERLARADGLTAAPDPRLGGAVNLIRPSLDDPARQQAAEHAVARQRASFTAFATEHVVRSGLEQKILLADLD